MYPREAIEACEALTHPLPHPTMHTRSIDVSHFAQHNHGAKVDTQHPGPIEMYEPPKASRIEVTTALIVTGILAALVLVAVAVPFIEHLPSLMGATDK